MPKVDKISKVSHEQSITFSNGVAKNNSLNGMMKKRGKFVYKS